MGKALIIAGADFSQVAVDTIDITVGQPTISINILGQVTITSPNGEDIYYTTDGTTPTKNNTKYTGAFSVQSGTTVKAVCYYGGNYSDVSSQLYDGTLQAPTISITNKGVVTITATDNASINYTTDGSDPTSSTGTAYSGTFSVENGVVVKAIAYISSGGTTITSSVSSETAVVPETAAFGKAFVVASSKPTGALKDDATRFVSPKIPAVAGSFTWTYTNATYGEDFAVCYNSQDQMVSAASYFNTAQASKKSGSVTKTAPAGTAYIRISNLMGASYAGCKIVQNGATLWSYDGSTE